MEPFEWQAIDRDLFVSNGGSGLQASQTGSGKSAVSLFTAKQMRVETLLVTGPKSTRSSWQEDAAAILPDMEFKPLGSDKYGKLNLLDLRLGKPGVYFSGIEWFRTLSWNNYKPDMHVADEVHMMANRGTAGQKALWTSKAEAKMAMSATMVRNKLENSWAVLKWQDPKMTRWQPTEEYFARHPEMNPNAPSEFSVGKKIRDLDPKNYWGFLELYFLLEQDYFSTKVVGERIPGEVFSLSPVYVRHLKRENCCEYHPNGFATWPEPQTKKISIEMTAVQKKAYNEMDKQDVAYLEGHPMVAKIPLESRMRKVQIALAEPMIEIVDDKPKVTFAPDAKSPKLDWIQEQADSGNLMDEQYIVMTHSKPWAKMAAARLGGFAWTGDEKQDTRDQAKQDFIAGKLRVVVAVISAFGTGTNGFQKVANNIVWASPGDDMTNLEQGQGRLDRFGSTKGMIEWFLQSEGTLEAGALSKQMEKRLNLNTSLRAKA